MPTDDPVASAKAFLRESERAFPSRKPVVAPTVKGRDIELPNDTGTDPRLLTRPPDRRIAGEQPKDIKSNISLRNRMLRGRR